MGHEWRLIPVLDWVPEQHLCDTLELRYEKNIGCLP